MRLLFLELYGHDEILRHLVHAFDFGTNRISIGCRRAAYERLPGSIKDQRRYNCHIVENNLSVEQFFTAPPSWLSNHDLTVLITVEEPDARFFATAPFSGRTVRVIHNGNTAFRTPGSLRWYGKLFRLHRMPRFEPDFHLFPEPYIAEHFVRSGAVEPDRVFPSPPFARLRRAVPKHERFTIAVPGTINGERKRTALLSVIARKICRRYPKVRWVFPGRCDMNVQRWGKPGQIVSHKEFTDLATYHRLLGEAHLWWLPVRPKTAPFGFWEQVGLTKISGGINDWRSHGAPILLPDFYMQNLTRDPIAIRYPPSPGQVLNAIETFHNTPEMIKSVERQNRRLLREFQEEQLQSFRRAAKNLLRPLRR